MRSILFTGIGFSMLYSQADRFFETLGFLSELNYLQLILLGYGLFLVKYVCTRIMHYEKIFTEDLVYKSVCILGGFLGIPLLIEYGAMF